MNGKNRKNKKETAKQNSDDRFFKMLFDDIHENNDKKNLRNDNVTVENFIENIHRNIIEEKEKKNEQMKVFKIGQGVGNEKSSEPLVYFGQLITQKNDKNKTENYG